MLQMVFLGWLPLKTQAEAEPHVGRILHGPCLQYFAMAHVVSQLHAADGGQLYGIPCEALLPPLPAMAPPQQQGGQGGGEDRQQRGVRAAGRLSAEGLAAALSFWKSLGTFPAADGRTLHSEPPPLGARHLVKLCLRTARVALASLGQVDVDSCYVEDGSRRSGAAARGCFGGWTPPPAWPLWLWSAPQSWQDMSRLTAPQQPPTAAAAAARTGEHTFLRFAKHANLTVRWLVRRGVPLHSGALWLAAGAGQLAGVRFLHEECGQELTERIFSCAVSSGSLPTARWLLQAGCPTYSDAYEPAASTGDAAVVLWPVREAQVPPTHSTLSDILEFWPRHRVPSGGLEPLVRSLVEAGFPPGDGAYETDSIGWAANHGDVRLVHYLREELGVPFAPCTIRSAACSGYEPVLEWLAGAGCVPALAEEGVGPWAWPLEHGLFCTLCCMRQLQVPWDTNILSVAEDRGVPLPVLRWLVEQGAPWEQEAVAAAVDDATRRGACGRTAEWAEARMRPGGPPHGGSGAAEQESAVRVPCHAGAAGSAAVATNGA